VPRPVVGDLGLTVTARRLALVALGLWTARWAAGELASYVGTRILPTGPPPLDSPRPPGWMPPPTVRKRWNG
jgi:hypothetical protein